MRGGSRFSASGTAKEIEGAFRGNGTDERLVIDILSTLDNDQRQDLADEYVRRYDEVRRGQRQLTNLEKQLIQQTQSF